MIIVTINNNNYDYIYNNNNIRQLYNEIHDIS